MYFLEPNFTRVHRGITKKNSKNLSKTNKTCKKFEAGDHVCFSDVNKVKNSVCLMSEESDIVIDDIPVRLF